LQPQVIVSLVANGTNAVMVGGEVNRAGPVPLSLRGERLLDVVAGAGGTKWQTSDSDVRIIRGSVSATIPLQQAVNNPADNIMIRPRDQIIVLRNPKTFTVMGAANKVSQYPLDQTKVTLTEALARAGGAIDTVGDISGIYIFREEPAEVVKRILEVDPTALDRTMGRSDDAVVAARVPVMYRIDLSQAEGYLLAQQLPIRDKDVVLVSNSQGTQLLKMMAIVRGVTGVVYDLSRTSNGNW
jgi:polysaccharide export outer membrane protein